MAFVTLEASKKTLSDAQDIQDFLKFHGITHQTWNVPEPLRPITQKDLLSADEKTQVLSSYATQLEALKERGYIQSDVISLCKQTPNVEELLRKFDHDHYHTEDE